MGTPPIDIVDRARPVVVTVDADTCDACPAEAKVQAYVYIELPSGKTLSMCSHHGTEHRDALHAAGAHIIDLSYTIGKTYGEPE